MITWIKQALNVPTLGSPPPRPGWWGGTRITAHGMTLFYNAVRHRPDVWPWLSNAMHHATVYGSDGTYQFFGLPSATSGAAIKQGWGEDSGNGQPEFNSTGFVNSDRYAVAILTQGGTYGTPIANMLTAEARFLMPNGRINNDNPSGHLDGIQLDGNHAVVRGWSFDPNATSSAVKIVVQVNGKLAAYGPTTVARGDVNAVYHISGYHGFALTVPHLADGTNTVCVYATNIGPGTNRLLACQLVHLTGSPVGAVDPLRVGGDRVTVTGWTYDYDVPSFALKAVVNVNGRLAAYGLTTINRPVFAAGAPIAGIHGYSFTLRLPDGANSICVYGINFYAGGNTLLGCRTAIVSGSPVGRVEGVTVSPAGVASVHGWTYDYDSSGLALKTVVYRNGRLAAYGPTNTARPDVNQTFGITGVHGYVFPVQLDPGTNEICVYGINLGPGANTALGCQTVIK